MSAATSPGTGLAYGLQRVCAAWGFARSSFYAMKSRQQATAERPPAKRRGPKPSISDEALLVAIEADLEASPWEGEGHRKVWARLRVCRGIRVSRKRVLRVMRENNLLSPHRCRRRGGNPHVGEIITHAPNLMWGTDGVRVFTVDDGWGWIFTAIEHWNAECVGWHVCKRGDRFAALSADLHGACEAVCLDLEENRTERIVGREFGPDDKVEKGRIRGGDPDQYEDGHHTAHASGAAIAARLVPGHDPRLPVTLQPVSRPDVASFLGNDYVVILSLIFNFIL